MTFIIPNTVLYAGALDSATLGSSTDYEERITVPTDKIRSVKFSTTPFTKDSGEVVLRHTGTGDSISYNAWISKLPGDASISVRSLVTNRSGYLTINYAQTGETATDTRTAKLNTSTDYFINIEKYDDTVGTQDLIFNIVTAPDFATSGSGTVIAAPAPTAEVPNPPPVYSSTPQFQYPPEWNAVPVVIDNAFRDVTTQPGSVNAQFPPPVCKFGSTAIPALGQCFQPENGYSPGFFRLPDWEIYTDPNIEYTQYSEKYYEEYIYIREDQVLSSPIIIPNYSSYRGKVQFLVPPSATTDQFVIWISRDAGMEAIDGIVTSPATEASFIQYTTDATLSSTSIPLLDAGATYHINVAYARSEQIDEGDPNAFTIRKVTNSLGRVYTFTKYNGRTETRLYKADYSGRRYNAAYPFDGKIAKKVYQPINWRVPAKPPLFYNGVMKRSIFHLAWNGSDQAYFGVQNG